MRQILLLVAAVLLFSGCASKFRTSDDKTWTPYIENNGTREQMSFLNSSRVEQNSTRPVVGIAVIKTNLGSRKIGDMRMLAHKTSNILLNLDDDTQLDASLTADKQRLKIARGLKFYEIKEGRIETIVYRSQKPLCATFLGGETIQTRSVTNYYLQENKGFFTTILETDMLAFKGANITKKEFLYEISDEQELESARKFTGGDGVKSLIDQDIKKQGRLLYILCSAL